jgi:nucleoside-diphosphate-sugar epimerase
MPIHLKRILVTGASGTLGYNVVQHLAKKHPETCVHVLMRSVEHKLFANLPNVTLEQVDMRDTPRLMAAISAFQPNAILHCAASGVRPSNIGYFDLVDLNVSATMHLFRASCEIDDCHFIHISTGLVYLSQEGDSSQRTCKEDDPINTLHPYGASKAAADCLLRSGAERLHRPLTIVRPFSFTGIHDGGDRLFPSLLRSASERKTFEMSPGTQLRDFCAVQDVVEAITLILEQGQEPGCNIVNLGSGLSLPLGDILQDVVRQLGLDVEIKRGARPFHPLEPLCLVADIARAQGLGWKPRTNLAYAVWQLAQSQAPNLQLTKPEQYR